MTAALDWHVVFDTGIQGFTLNIENLNASLLEMTAIVLKLSGFKLKFPVGL